jgi:hypothetical protein
MLVRPDDIVTIFQPSFINGRSFCVRKPSLCNERCRDCPTAPLSPCQIRSGTSVIDKIIESVCSQVSVSGLLVLSRKEIEGASGRRRCSYNDLVRDTPKEVARVFRLNCASPGAIRKRTDRET